MEDNRIAYEVIVVDDGSRDGTAEVAEAWARRAAAACWSATR